MNRQEKKEIAEVFHQLSTDYACFVVVRQSGLVAEESALLRRELRNAGCIMRVMKNTLVKKALEKNTEKSGLIDHFYGPTAVFFSQDPVSLSKVIVDFSKKKKEGFEIVAGILDNTLLHNHHIVALSNTPSIEVLHGRLLYALTSSARQLLALMLEPSRRIVRVLDAHQKKNS